MKILLIGLLAFFVSVSVGMSYAATIGTVGDNDIPGNLGLAGVTSPCCPLHMPGDGMQFGNFVTASDNFHITSDDVGGRSLKIWNGNFGAGSLVFSVTDVGDLSMFTNKKFFFDGGVNDFIVGGGDRISTIAGGTETLTVTNGKVGIKVLNPLSDLHLTGNGFQIGASGSAVDNFHVTSDAGLGLRVWNGDFGAGSLFLTLEPDGDLKVIKNIISDGDICIGLCP